MNRFITSSTFMVAALALAAPHAWAETPCATVTGNLVKNCSFETGDVTGWTQTGGVPVGNPTVAAADGTYYAEFAQNVGSDGTLSQTLATISGTSYTISFYLDAFNGQTPNQAIVDFGGTQVGDLENIAVNGWNEYSFTATANSASTVLEFQIGNSPATTYLDNVVVSPNAPAVPEPATWALFAGGALVTAAFGRKRPLLLRD